MAGIITPSVPLVKLINPLGPPCQGEVKKKGELTPPLTRGGREGFKDLTRGGREGFKDSILLLHNFHVSKQKNHIYPLVSTHPFSLSVFLSYGSKTAHIHPNIRQWSLHGTNSL